MAIAVREEAAATAVALSAAKLVTSPESAPKPVKVEAAETTGPATLKKAALTRDLGGMTTPITIMEAAGEHLIPTNLQVGVLLVTTPT